MEYVDGETLAQIVAKVKDAEPETETPFGKKDCARYFEQLARAFADVDPIEARPEATELVDFVLRHVRGE